MAAGDTLQGRRVDTIAGIYSTDAQPGDYCKVREADSERVIWYVRDPTGKIGALRTHEVVEHDDGTITVSPSILDSEPGGWHGWLERGVWREA